MENYPMVAPCSAARSRQKAASGPPAASSSNWRTPFSSAASATPMMWSNCRCADSRGSIRAPSGNRVARNASICEHGAMRSAAKPNSQIQPPDIGARVAAIDWAQATTDLDAQGCAVLKGLLLAEECHALAGLYPDDENFRSRVV